MKIGVLTFHRCINYGSYWQATCLANGLAAMGHNVEILDHYDARVNIAEWKCAYRPVLPTHVPDSDYPLYRKKIERFFEVFETMPLSQKFALHEPVGLGTFDAVVVGSDEVWNLSHPWYGGCPLFFGDGIPTNLVSYAASIGNYNGSWGIPEEWADKLRQFSFISVRDANTSLMVEKALGFVPELVLDPCLQFDIVPAPRMLPFNYPYIAVYGHNFTSWYIAGIKEFAAKCKLPLISIGYRNDWADEQWIPADPHDFAHFISHASAVATNFFHGCVFALRNAKPFICESSTYRSHKVQGLMATVGGAAHLADDKTDLQHYSAMLSTPVSSAIFNRIEALRTTSANYLIGALPVAETLRA